jgi:signal transduction histidine kinase
VSQHLANQDQFVGSQAASVAMIALERVDGALVICDEDGLVLGGSPRGLELLLRSGMNTDVLPAPLARDFWNVIMAHDASEAVQWRPNGDRDFLLSCTRCHIDEDDWLLIISEISQKQSALAYRLHHQRLETLGRVVATAVHDLRAPLSSIVFGIDVLAQRVGELPTDRTREIVKDVRSASFCLRETIDCLLDFLRLGPPAPSEVSIKKVLSRTQSLLRPQLRMGPHELVVIVDNDVLVSGNLLTIEQIFVNLVVNSLEAAEGPTTVHVTTSIEDKRLRVLVEDSGPGIRADHRHLVFEPMFTTKQHGVGLGLTSAREAARSIGGDIQLVRWTDGTTFAVLLPMCSSQEAT